VEQSQPLDSEELLQKPEGESGAQESPRREVEELLRVLDSGLLGPALLDAAEQLATVGTNSRRIVRALTSACGSEP
jgi:hypothetical protein